MKKYAIFTGALILTVVIIASTAMYARFVNEQELISSIIQPVIAPVASTTPIATPGAEPILIIQPGDPEALKKITAALVPLGAEARTLSYFSPRSDYYVHDANSVYWIFAKAKKVEGADPSSFFVFADYGNIVARDRSHVYMTSNIVPNANPETFTVVGKPIGPNNAYFKDDKSVFYKEQINIVGDYSYGLREVAGADPQTIHTFENVPTGILAADDKHVYVRGEPVQGIDGKTFALVADPYFIDKQNTYFFSWSGNGDIQLLSATSTTRVLTHDYISGGYLIMGNQVAFGTTTITRADASSLRVLDSEIPDSATINRGPCVGQCFYAADKNAVYYKAQKLISADPKIFDLLGYGLLHGLGKDAGGGQPAFGRDATHVYYLGEEVVGADPKTFTPIISGGYYYEYGKDDSAVYWKSKRIEHADPKTFRALEGQQPYEGCAAGRYGIDATGAYYQNMRVEGADIKTFKVVYGAGDYAEDALHFYHGNQPSNKKELRYCEFG